MLIVPPVAIFLLRQGTIRCYFRSSYDDFSLRQCTLEVSKYMRMISKE